MRFGSRLRVKYSMGSRPLWGIRTRLALYRFRDSRRIEEREAVWPHASQSLPAPDRCRSFDDPDARSNPGLENPLRGKAAQCPARQRSARISCNSAIRQARALFSRKMMKFIRSVALPDPLPFVGAEFYPRESLKYQSKLDPAVLLQSASRRSIGIRSRGIQGALARPWRRSSPWGD